MAKTEPCTVLGCEKAAAASLDGVSFCQEHFISTCYKEIDRYTHLVREAGFRRTAAESMHHFLTECTRQATDLSQHAEELDNLARARLLDILLSAADLSRHLRRSPRKVATLALRLHCEKPGRTWEEETKTRVLSRHGALVECQHPAQSGDALLVLRLDSGRQALARVVWCHQKEEGRREIGIEFLDCDNFWELDWSVVETTV